MTIGQINYFPPPRRQRAVPSRFAAIVADAERCVAGS
jgi:hypothetical protein